MHYQTDKWLAGDWVVLGAHIPHWVAAIVGLILVTFLVAWLERPQRGTARSSPRSHPEHRSTLRSSPGSALD